MKNKITIAISYDFNDWILKRWADHIKYNYSNKYNIILFSHILFDRNQNYFIDLFKQVDFIHMLVPYYVNNIRNITDKPIINSFNHWIRAREDMIKELSIKSDYIMTVSNQWKYKLINEIGYENKDNIFVVHCGVEERFLTNKKVLYKKTNNKISIGFFAKNSSNEYDRKGTRHFIKLLNHIKDRGLQNKFRIIVSGTGWNNLLSDYKEFEIIYNEFTKDKYMPALYKSLDFYLILSDVEGGPAAILESMACKVMVLSTNVGLVMDIGKDNDNCSIINNENSKEILDKILYYYKNKNEYNRIIDNGFKLASSMTYKDTFKDIAPMYDKVVSNIDKLSNSKIDLIRTQKYLDLHAHSVKIWGKECLHFNIFSKKIIFAVDRKKLEKIVWWIPFKKLREKLRNSYYIEN